MREPREFRHRAKEKGFREGGHSVRCCRGLQENQAWERGHGQLAEASSHLLSTLSGQ